LVRHPVVLVAPEGGDPNDDVKKREKNSGIVRTVNQKEKRKKKAKELKIFDW